MVKTRKMSENSCGYSERNPQFFKVYVPSRHSSQRLRIPPAFIKYLKGVLPSKSILRTSTKRSWRIDMNKVDNNFFFQKGWLEFVRDNSLVFGDFLIFCYTGNSEFYVTIFGKNNCQKEIPITTRDNDEPQPLLQRNQTVRPCESEERMCVDSVEMGTTCMPIKDNIGVLETPSKLAPKKPFFETVLKPTHVHFGYMYIPSGFVESYMPSHRQTASLLHSNKSWLVKLMRRGNGIVISCGWRKFVADNTLREGDVCSFELIQRDDYAFDVAIVRGNGTPPHKGQGTKTTQPSSNREEGEYEEGMSIDSVEMGTTCMPLQDNIGALETPTALGTKKPFFESVMNPTYVHTGYMYIPVQFVKDYLSTSSETATLMHMNKSWLVKLIRRRNRLVFSCGWGTFVADNTLREGDVCSFELIQREDYAFNVAILRGNGTPDKAQRTKTTRPSSSSSSSSSREEGESKERMCVDNMEMGTTCIPVRDDIGDLETPSELGTKKPFFESVLKPTYVHAEYMYIPSEFTESYMSTHRQTARLTHSNKSWLVKLIRRGNIIVFSCGWRKFVADNTLREGDVCRFELIQRDDYAFNVAILRGNGTLPDEARGTKPTQPSSCREEGKSQERRGKRRKEEGSKRTIEANIEDSSKHPYFRIVLTPVYLSKVLSIPSKFQKSYLTKPKATATLQYSNKRWLVNLITYKDGRLFFCGGWHKFVKQNSLQVGDVCSFALIEKENFVFTVSISRGKSKEIGGVEDAFEKFTSKHPFFHVVLSPAYVSRHLCIPSKFWKSYIDEPKATARLQCSNKWWMVKLRGYGYHGSYFATGWGKFVEENSLQVGDACCFELIEKENYVFKVSIARRINNSTPS